MIKDIGKYTSNTRVLISFGGASGGFEFAMQLRADIMDKYKKDYNKNLDFVYLDAESLKQDPSSSYTWDSTLGIYKMSNPFWDEYYKGAMKKCDIMIFQISEHWLKSKWCWQEFKWFQYLISMRQISPVFVIFKDAQKILDGSAMVTDKDGEQRSIKEIWQTITTNKNSSVIYINSDPIKELQSIVVDNETYTYQYKYVCNSLERSTILRKIVVRNP